MKILQVVEGLREASGVSTFVKNLSSGLKSAGNAVDICTKTNDLLHMKFSGRFTYDIIHIHGLWCTYLHKAAVKARQHGVPIVWSTHGMTAPWAMKYKWFKKIPAWWLYQRRDLKNASAIHSTTEQEVEWNRHLGLTSCIVAPLGTYATLSDKECTSGDGFKRLLFVGRLNPIKGLENLLKAWRMSTKNNLEVCCKWRLRIVGPDQSGYRCVLENLVNELNISKSVEFAGAKFGAELSDEYAQSDCLTLPSFTENFGATIVDALAHCKPCIASTYTPWRDLIDYGCGWWISNEPHELSLAISEMMSLTDEERRHMGERGWALVKEKYTWDAVVKAMIKGYEDVLR